MSDGSLAERVRWLMTATGSKSARDLARKAGLKSETHVGIILDTGTAKLVTIEALARAAGVRPGWLAFGELPRYGEPAAFDLTHYLSHFIKSQDLVAEVLKDPAQWSPQVVVNADAMRNAKDYEGWPAARRLKHAKNVLENARTGDVEGIDRMVQKEYGPKDPKPKKRKRKRDRG